MFAAKIMAICSSGIFIELICPYDIKPYLLKSEVNTTYVRQTRVMVTGKDMTNAASTYTRYFDAKSILNSARTAE